MGEQQQRETATTTSAHSRKPMTLRVCFALHFVAAAAAMGAAITHLITVKEIHPAVGPVTYGISTLGGAFVLGLVFFISARRGTGGSGRGRLVATYLLVLSGGLLLLGPLMLVAVVPAFAALMLLWAPSSGAYVRAATAAGVAEDHDSELAALVNSDSSGPSVPWANSMPGNPHQPGI
ncbi:hypothetical protein ACHABX_05905 [Nesterenkonia halotolerans]|uniref:hypothetical protein n=1 Tax=Nesterenkonia halotolerans TaxID=225325 RepID=UPI003EE64FD2